MDQAAGILIMGAVTALVAPWLLGETLAALVYKGLAWREHRRYVRRLRRSWGRLAWLTVLGALAGGAWWLWA
jgi:hypothetical protein